MSVDFYRTYQSPINNSSSKQLYSFSRANRFEQSKRSLCKQTFYEISRGAFEKRATSFGFGNKINFVNTQGVPDAGVYTKLSQFTDNKTKRRGFSFGKDQNRSLIDNPQEVRKLPGPGSYISINEKHKTGYGSSFQKISYSMRGKYQDPLSKHGNDLGPGHYPTTGSISARGIYFNTKFQNSKSPILSKNTRFQAQRVQTPGPGHYYGEKKVNLNGTGIYFNSKHSTTKANNFGLSERPSPAKKNQAPDPGSYHQFSEFALRNRTHKVSPNMK